MKPTIIHTSSGHEYDLVRIDPKRVALQPLDDDVDRRSYTRDRLDDLLRHGEFYFPSGRSPSDILDDVMDQAARADGGTTAADCPNCRDGVDDDGCPHLLAGDDCPNCPSGVLEKPPAGKVRCPNCFHVINGRNRGYELKDFTLTHRQGQRLLAVFGYDHHGTPGDIGTRLRRFCSDHDIDRDELNDFLADLRADARNWSKLGDADD